MAGLNHVDSPLPYVKLRVEFEFAEADGAQSAIGVPVTLEAAVRAV